MIFNSLVTAFTNRNAIKNKLQSGIEKSDSNEVSPNSRYEQRRISNRLFK